jgi:hypothetical protein
MKSIFTTILSLCSIFAIGQSDSIMVARVIPNLKDYPSLVGINSSHLQAGTNHRTVRSDIPSYYFQMVENQIVNYSGSVVMVAKGIHPSTLDYAVTTSAFRSFQKQFNDSLQTLKSADTVTNKSIINLSDKIDKIPCTLLLDTNSECYKSLINAVIEELEKKYRLVPKE